MIAWRKRVEPVLDDVEVTSRQSHRAEVVERMVDKMKLVRFISLAHLPYHFIKLGERPSVNLQHFIIRYRVARRIKPMKIAERKARRVAQFAITVGDSLEDFLRAAHVLKIIR